MSRPFVWKDGMAPKAARGLIRHLKSVVVWKDGMAPKVARRLIWHLKSVTVYRGCTHPLGKSSVAVYSGVRKSVHVSVCQCKFALECSAVLNDGW